MKPQFARAGAVILATTVVVVPVSLAGQATRGSRSPQRDAVPRLADGRPSLEGTWNYSSLTPLERPAAFANRPTLTLAEAERYENDVRARNNADQRDSDPNVDVARAYNDAWYDRGTHMAIVNGVAQTSLITDPPSGRAPALTEAARLRQQARAVDRRDHPADGPENRSLAERCLGFNAGPPMLPGPYNNYVQLFQFPGYVVIFNEMIHDARIVPTDGRAHLPPTMRRYQGDSVGKWEGDTLVVDTTNFTETTAFRGASDALHLVERFTRVNAETLLYQFTVDDSSSFTAPWTVTLPMSRTDEQVYEYACHEGNHAMVGILRGARYGEGTPK